MMLLQLGRYEQTGGVDLVQPASGFVVAVDGVGGVVEDDDGGLGHYIKIFQKEGFTPKAYIVINLVVICQCCSQTRSSR